MKKNDKGCWGTMPRGALSLIVLTFPTALVAAQQITLQEAVGKAMERSPAVSQAESDYAANVEKKRGAWSNAGPKVSAQYNESYFGKQQTAQLGPQTLVLRDDTVKMGSLTVAQPITGIYAVAEYAHLVGLNTEMAEEGLGKARRDTGFAAAESYLQAYLAVEQERIAEESLQAAQSQFKDASAIAGVGRLNQADLLKFQIALSQANSRRAQSRATKHLSMAALKMAIQAPMQEDIELQKDLPAPQKVEVASGDLRDLVKKRVEFRQAMLGEEIAGAGVKVAYAQFIPNVNLFYKIDHNFGTITGMGGEKDTHSYGVSLQWDIWNNGSSVFAVREAVNQKSKASAMAVGATDGLQLDLMQAKESTEVAQESLKLAEDAVKQAEEAYRIDVIRFKSGQMSATDMIQSESSRSNAQGQLVAAKIQSLTWALKLQKALGFTEPKI